MGFCVYDIEPLDFLAASTSVCPVDLVWLEKTFFGRNSCSYDLHRPIYIHFCIKVFFLICSNSPPGGQDFLIHEVSRSHTTTHYIPSDFSGRMINWSQRSLPDNTQHSQQTDIHAPGGIRTHNLSKRVAAVLRHIPRGYWDLRIKALRLLN